MKRVVDHFLLIGAIIFLSVIGACAQLGVAPPKTFLESAAAAQVTVTGVRQSALDLLNANVINAKQASAARDAANAGNQAIDLSLEIYSEACPLAVAPPAASAPPPAPCTSDAASAKLNAAVAILTAARTILVSYSATHQGK